MQIAFGIAHRLAGAVGDRGIEVVDFAQTVAAERERGRGDADTVLAEVEGVLEVVSGARVAVGDDHLRERRAVKDRPAPVAVAVCDLVEDEALARGEADV